MSTPLFSILLSSLALAGCGEAELEGATGAEQTAASCTHDICTSGTKLQSGCNSCVARICAADSYCCNTKWSSQCVAEVASICGQTCGGGGGSGGGTAGGGGTTGGDDGTPTRQQCTGKFGSGLSTAHGRLDGYLVSIVAPGGSRTCNGDSSHVHLQVMMKGAIYDVAVDTGSSGDDIYYLAQNMTIPDGSWSEGWHSGDALSYQSLGVKSTAFAKLSPTAAPTTVENELAGANHISVFGTGYDASGMHLIHYDNGKDGAIVINPQAATSRLLLFHFAEDTF